MFRHDGEIFRWQSAVDAEISAKEIELSPSGAVDGLAGEDDEIFGNVDDVDILIHSLQARSEEPLCFCGFAYGDGIGHRLRVVILFSDDL